MLKTLLILIKIYGGLERVVKWLKIMLIVGLCVLMIMINVGGECTAYMLHGCSSLILIPSYSRRSHVRNHRCVLKYLLVDQILSLYRLHAICTRSFSSMGRIQWVDECDAD